MAITTIGTNGIADNIITGAKVALASQAAGDIMYYNGTDWIRLAKGTADQVLTMNDGATAPGWEAASAGAALSGSTNNTVVTVTGANAMIGEAGLTYDGTTLISQKAGGGTAAAISVDSYSTTAGVPGVLNLRHSKHGTLGTLSTATASGDELGMIAFSGSNGSAFADGATISGIASAAWGGSASGTDIVFYNAPDDSASRAKTFQMHSTGALSLPKQPCVFAVNTSRDANVTGDAAVVTVDFNEEVIDSPDFVNDTFTAPVTGKYLVSVGIMLVGTNASSYGYIICKMISSNRTIRAHHESYLANNIRDRMWINAARIIDMDANDEVYIQLVVNGQTANDIDIEGSASSDCHTSVSIALLA